MHLDDGCEGVIVSLFGAVARHVTFPAADEADRLAARANAVVDEAAVHAPAQRRRVVEAPDARHLGRVGAPERVDEAPGAARVAREDALVVVAAVGVCACAQSPPPSGR